MGERKVLVKYYPPDFDPKYLKKNYRPPDKQDNVRMMMPFTCRCNTCGSYAGIGTKFNMRKETCLDESYLGIRIYRFYFKCSLCKSEITFKTDPKNHDYIVEHGATRNYDPQRDQQAAEEVLRQIRENDEEGNAMAFLENRTNDSKREIEINEALEEIRHLNKRQTKITPDQLLRQLTLYEADEGNEAAESDDEEEKEQAKQYQLQLEIVKDRMKVKRLRQQQDYDDDGYYLSENAHQQEEESVVDQNKKNQILGTLKSNNDNQKEQKRKNLLPIIKKKQIVEGEQKLNLVPDQKKVNLAKILPQKQSQNDNNSTQQLNALCDYSDSD